MQKVRFCWVIGGYDRCETAAMALSGDVALRCQAGEKQVKSGRITEPLSFNVTV